MSSCDLMESEKNSCENAHCHPRKELTRNMLWSLLCKVDFLPINGFWLKIVGEYNGDMVMRVGSVTQPHTQYLMNNERTSWVMSHHQNKIALRISAVVMLGAHISKKDFPISWGKLKQKLNKLVLIVQNAIFHKSFLKPSTNSHELSCTPHKGQKEKW